MHRTRIQWTCVM